MLTVTDTTPALQGKDEFVIILSKVKLSGKKQEFWITGETEREAIKKAKDQLAEWDRKLNSQL